MEWLFILAGIGLIETIYEKLQDKKIKPNYRELDTGHQSTLKSPHHAVLDTVKRNIWTEAITGRGLTPGSYWYNKRQEVLQRDGYTCTRCGITKNLSIDHKTPLSLGGDDSMHNLTTLCRDCHENKDQRQIFNRDFDADDNYGRNTNLSRKIKLISAALTGDKIIKISYCDSKGHKTIRTIQPKQLVKNKNRIYLIAHCYLRNDKRTFRLSRAEIKG